MSKKIKKQKIRAETRSASTFGLWLQSDNNSYESIGYSSLLNNSEVRKCVHIVADAVSNMTLMLMQNGENGDVRVYNELSRKLDITPNKFLNRKQLIYKIVSDMILYGNSVVVPEYSGEYLDNLLPLNGKNLSFVSDFETRYKINYGSASFSPDEVLHFSLIPDDDEPFRGVGYAKIFKDNASNLIRANKTKENYLKSEYKPSLIISIEADNEELQDESSRTKILESYFKTSKAGEPWLIPAGDMKIEKIQPLTLSDLAISESVELDLKELALCMGIKPFMVGIGDFNKEAYNNFIATTVMSFAAIIQQEMSRKIITSERMYVRFNPKSLMQYDITEKMTYTADMVKSGMMSRNEGRNEFDLPPVDKDGMNDYIVLENYIPVSSVGNQKKLKEGDTNEK